MTATAMRSEDIQSLLRGRYAPPEYAYLPQVRSSTGFNPYERYADGLAISTYPSRGIHLHGIEIKVSRADWRRELRRPEKAEPIAQYCTYWWLAAPDGVIPLDEVPQDWGLLEVHGSVLRATKQATKRKAEALSLGFVAAIMRKALDTVMPEAMLKAEFDRGFREGTASAAAGHKTQLEWDLREMESLKASVQRFQEKTGIRIDGYNGERLGETVALVQSVRGGSDFLRRMERFEDMARELMLDAQTMIGALKE